MIKRLIISQSFHYKWYKSFYEKNNFDFFPIYDFIISKETFNTLINKNYDEYDSVLLVFSNLSLTEHLSTFSVGIETFEESWKNFISSLPNKFKFIFFDDFPERPNDTVIGLNNFLNTSDRTFVISQRHGSLIHERAITNLIYLNIISSFYTLHFNEMPKLDYSPPSKPINDFRTYIGIDIDSKKSKREQRLNDIKFILNNDISNLKYKEKDDFKVFTGFESFSMTWNLLESLNSKIQLIFENMGPSSRFDDSYNITEKTTKCFYLPHPYILLVHSDVIEKLKMFGFKFSYSCKSTEDFRELLTEVRSDIDEWIEKNKLDFYHNQDNLFNLVKTHDLPHYDFLNKILEI
jgi:hypothetical protein